MIFALLRTGQVGNNSWYVDTQKLQLAEGSLDVEQVWSAVLPVSSPNLSLPYNTLWTRHTGKLFPVKMAVSVFLPVFSCLTASK